MKQIQDIKPYRYYAPSVPKPGQPSGQTLRAQAMRALEQKQRRRARFRRTVSVLTLLVFVTGGIGVALAVQRTIVASAKQTATIPAPATLKAAQISELSPKLSALMGPIAAASSSSVDVAVYDHTTGQTAEYTNASGTYSTASIMKLSILEELLLQDQAAGTGITSDQLAEATPMIENSDNDAATALWQDVGAGATMQTFFNRIGATSTYVNPAGHWGLTQTTALDQLKVLNQYAYPTSSTLLSSDSIATITSLLSNVEPDQQWGVTAGTPASATVELKDGWLDESGGWDVNSIGHVSGVGTDYTIAILSKGNASEQSGITLVKSLSQAAASLLS